MAGNIRELENAVLRAVSLSYDIIYREHLPARVRFTEPVSTPVQGEDGLERAGYARGPDGRWMTLAEVEEDYVSQVLVNTGGNKQAASRILNIDRKTLARIIGRTPKS